MAGAGGVVVVALQPSSCLPRDGVVCTGLLACVCCRDFTGLSGHALSKQVSELRWRWMYVTRSAWDVTDCSVQDGRWEQRKRGVTEAKRRIRRSPLIQRIIGMLVWLSITWEGYLLYGDES